MAPAVLPRSSIFAGTLLQHAIRHQARLSSTASGPLVKLTSIPAPHCGSIRILSLNRPASRNAISKALLAELSHHVNQVASEGENQSTRALIVASEIDTSFCAGADLKERATFTPEQTNGFLSSLRGTFNTLSRLPIPTISAVSSLAFGGGLELALSTNLRVFSSNAVVALPETRLGIIPGAGGTYRLPALVGLNRARDLILTGRRVAGPEAYFLGLCDRLVQVMPEEMEQEGKPREKVLSEAVRLATEICEGAPVAIAAGMAAVDGCAGGEAVENQMYDLVVRTEDRDEALRAFREKRKPMFKGR